MDREIDLATADRDVLIAIIVRQQVEKRIAQLEGSAKARGSGSDARSEAQSRPETGPAQRASPARPHGFARSRMTPTQRVEHVVGGVSRLRNSAVRWLDPAHSGNN